MWWIELDWIRVVALLSFLLSSFISLMRDKADVSINLLFKPTGNVLIIAGKSLHSHFNKQKE